MVSIRVKVRVMVKVRVFVCMVQSANPQSTVHILTCGHVCSADIYTDYQCGHLL